MKKLLVSAFALAAFAGPGMAADLYTPMPVMYDWNGAYLGGHAGYLWGEFDYSSAAGGSGPGPGPGPGPSGPGGPGIAGSIDVDGFVGGIVGGWNFQNGPWVFGLEGDFGWSGADGSASITPPPGGPTVAAPPSVSANVDLNWNAHIRGRVGMTLGETGNTLLFIAGGLALADVDASGFSGGVSETVGGTYTGWTIGGGVNQAFSSNLIGGIEVLYDDYGSKSYEVGGGSCGTDCIVPTTTFNTDLDAFTVRGTLTYHFN